MSQQTRPAAVPLITCDPYFSVWSCADHLTDDKTRHWTGAPHSMFGFLKIDGVSYCYLGKPEATDIAPTFNRSLKQVSVTVLPTSTIYQFSHTVCDFSVTFFTPLFLDKPEIFSRPVSYMAYEIKPKEPGHTFEVYFDVSCQLASDLQNDMFFEVHREKGHVWLGNAEQNILNRCGDDVRIDWGYLHLVHENAAVTNLRHRQVALGEKPNMKDRYPEDMSRQSTHICPVLSATSQKLSDLFVVAYDDIHSIEYNHQPVDCYYKSVYGSFDAMLEEAVDEAPNLLEECKRFDEKFMKEMEQVSPLYPKIGAIAYRQAVAAHKLVTVNGEMMFLSKECFSNGCLATLDVTYPSIPLFLLYNPELVRGMMRPLFAFARSDMWGSTPYAPHDCGCYPFCNGQVYGIDKDVINPDQQMPVEECGNAILVMAAILAVDPDRTFLDENRDLLQKWADYLVEYGYNPGNQLCTDDFAGHLAHNCNLSLKAIVALGAFAKMFHAPKYTKIAKDMARRWVLDAKIEGAPGYRLTFDRNDTWSLKYNIVWDKLLHLNLFPKSVFREEIKVYKQKMNRYGVPLDSRSDYTKTDWLEWTTVMTDDRSYCTAVHKAILRMIDETVERVPLTDWYYTSTGHMHGFQARSVVGGLFINLLKIRLA